MGAGWNLGRGALSCRIRKRSQPQSARSPMRPKRSAPRFDEEQPTTGVSRMHAHVWHHHQRAIAPFEYRAPSPFAPLLALLVVGAIIAFFFFMIVMPVD